MLRRNHIRPHLVVGERRQQFQPLADVVSVVGAPLQPLLEIFCIFSWRYEIKKKNQNIRNSNTDFAFAAETRNATTTKTNSQYVRSIFCSATHARSAASFFSNMS